MSTTTDAPAVSTAEPSEAEHCPVCAVPLRDGFVDVERLDGVEERLLFTRSLRRELQDATRRLEAADAELAYATRIADGDGVVTARRAVDRLAGNVTAIEQALDGRPAAAHSEGACPACSVSWRGGRVDRQALERRASERAKVAATLAAYAREAHGLERRLAILRDEAERSTPQTSGEHAEQLDRQNEIERLDGNLAAVRRAIVNARRDLDELDIRPRTAPEPKRRGRSR